MAQRGYFSFMTGTLLTAVIMSLPNESPPFVILRYQEMHTGTPEYRAYIHQGAVKNCLALRRVLPKLSAMAGVLRDKFLPIVSISIYCISCRLPHCLSQSILLQVILVTSFAISSLSKLLPRSPTPAGASSAPLVILRAYRYMLCPRMTQSDMSWSWTT